MNWSYKRKFLVIAIMLACYAGYIWFQAMQTLVIHGDAYRAKVPNSSAVTKEVTPVRGFIFADGGELLAGSLPEYDLFLDFKTTTRTANGHKPNIPSDTIAEYFSPSGKGTKALATAFSDNSRNLKSADRISREIREAYSQRKNHYKILHALPYLDYKQLRQQPYFKKTVYKNGLQVEERAHRYRPYGERRMAAATIGSVYAKDGQKANQKAGHGSSGLERSMDRYLAGIPGTRFVQTIQSRNYNVVTQAAVNGSNVHTTIDVEMQEILDRELSQRIVDLNAAAGWAAFVEVKTGKIKAISNMRRSGNTCEEDYNHLFEDLMDPGSTFKTVTYMIMLEDGKITPETRVNTGNPVGTPSQDMTPWVYFTQRIRDDHAVGEVSAHEAIEQSSNIAIAKLATKAYEDNPQVYLDAIEKIGFLCDRQPNDSDRAEIKRNGFVKHPSFRDEFPGAIAARHRQITGKTWSKVSLAQISYGYESQIPGIYMLQFYNAIANDGKMVRPYLVDYIEKDGDIEYKQKPTVINKKICSNSTLEAVRRSLEGVVLNGTARGKGKTGAVYTDKVAIAGKTGTAQRINANGTYSGAGHNVSFIGYFPADEPEYCGIVVINTQGSGIANAGGGYMAGPVFRRFAEQIYARNCRRKLKELEPDSTPLAPRMKIGSMNISEMVASELDLDRENLEMPSREFKNQTKGVVPNVKGMGANDALAALEFAGYYNVQIVGYGQVISQNPAPGTRLDIGYPVIVNLK